MALSNFSLHLGAAALHPWSITTNPFQPNQISTDSNHLLYDPAAHQQNEDNVPPLAGSNYYRNSPYGPPQSIPNERFSNQQYTSNLHRKIPNTYLPPIPTTTDARVLQHSVDNPMFKQSQNRQPSNNVEHSPATSSQTLSASSAQTFSRSYGEHTYSPFPPPVPTLPPSKPKSHFKQQFHNQYNTQTRISPPQQLAKEVQQQTANNENTRTNAKSFNSNSNFGREISNSGDDSFPNRPPGFTRVQAGQGTRTQVHAVLDYDVEDDEEGEEYYDDEESTENDGRKKSLTVTPIQGPILLKNGTVPVVPLFSYPTVNNGSFVQIPIWWTALSVALGLDVRGDVIKGVPCIKRYHQLFCPTAGNTYPIDKIERFIDDNKALMRRMYGDFEMNMDSGGSQQQQTKRRKRRFIDEPDLFIPPGAFPAVLPPDDDEGPYLKPEAGESYFGNLRTKRQSSSSGRNRDTKSSPNFNPNNSGRSPTGRLDACESKVEIVTPYWASNSAGKIRAVVNTQHFEQAIHQEICSKVKTPRCQKDCGCEQKYKWHRLLAYDPDNDCKGIFMDWFLFPSCCVCRCNP